MENFSSNLSRISQVVYNEKEGKWIVFEGDELEKETHKKRSELKILSLNVLFDERFSKIYKPNIVFSSERYHAQFCLFEKHNCDILCLNEVTKGFEKAAKNCKWIQENYFISCYDYGDSMGNMVLSKFPFKKNYLLSVSGLSRSTILGMTTDLVICCAHLTAYSHNYERRKSQLEAIVGCINKFPFSDKNCLILGDLNFHSEEENKMIPEEYFDMWMKLHPEDYQKGYTFDCKKNKMIYEMWPAGHIVGFDSRNLQMRLDRHLLKAIPGSGTCVQSMQIVANERVYPKGEGEEEEEENRAGLFKNLASAFGDLFQKSFFRKKEEYLFCSDHFGLLSKIKVCAK